MRLSPRYDDPGFISIDGRADDQGAIVRDQRRRFEALLGGLTADEWQAPSRCAGWTVQDVVAHLVGVNAFWEASVRAGLAGTPTRMLAAFDPAAHPPLMIEPMRALSSREILDQFVASNDGFLDALAALDDAGWSTLAEAPPGHVSIRILAAHALWDSWVHERDVALPLGVTFVEQPDEVASCLRYAAAVGPALAATHDGAFRGELAVDAHDPQSRFTIAVGESVVIRDGTPDPRTPCLRGTAVDLVEALSIRAPLAADAPPEWHELLQGLATVFDAVP